jgi:SAM-dependent methyltransferase
MIGKVVLPYLGGTPQVWNSCMVFFQAVLLAGYLYSHEITRRFGLKRQVLFQVVLLLLPLAPLVVLKLDVAKIAQNWLPPPTESNPIQWLLLVLALVAGLPFFVVATSAPLLQKWYADTGAMGAKDPYFLYGASNLGSMLALVAYPTLIEPNLLLPEQARYWVIGYATLLTLTLICGLCARYFSASKLKRSGVEWLYAAQRQTLGDSGVDRVPLLRRLRWVLLAFVPSSLMLGVTTYVTTDIAPVALLWIIPLTIYLLTFILVFTRLPRVFDFVMLAVLLAAAAALVLPKQLLNIDDRPLRDVLLTEFLPLQLGPVLSGFLAVRHLLYFVCFVLVCLLLPRVTHTVMVLSLPVVIVLLILPLPQGHVFSIGWGEWRVWSITIQLWHKIPLHFFALFVAAMVCHGELARTRPSTRHLTGFYLCMSVGGVLGGLFNAMVAPLAFNSIVEYPLVIAGACILLPRLPLPPERGAARWLDLIVPTTLGTFGVVALFLFLQDTPLVSRFMQKVVLPHLPAAWHRPNDNLTEDQTADRGRVIHQERNFFGVVRIISYYDNDQHWMVHGTTNHGINRFQGSPTTISSYYVPLLASQPDNALFNAITFHAAYLDSRREPMAYFHRFGPIGDLFQVVRDKNLKQRIAVLGMGTGTLAAYAEPGWEMTFYEIDPSVERIAFDRRYFTYLSDARDRGVRVESVLGDGRLQIQKAPDNAYDLIFMDAFTSDAVPVHLLTKEAVEMYLTKLAPGGIIVINIANRYLDFKPILGNLAADLKLCAYYGSSREVWWVGMAASAYVVLVRDAKDLGDLPSRIDDETGDPRWPQVLGDPRTGVWTDKYSNLLTIFQWSW